jgi:hypothetical protein
MSNEQQTSIFEQYPEDIEQYLRDRGLVEDFVDWVFERKGDSDE